MVEGLIRPRESIARLLSRNPTLADAALMVVLTYCVSTIVQILVPLVGGASGVSLFGHVVNIVVSIAGTFLIGVLIHAAGRVFGGQATRDQAIVAASWQQLVMLLLLPLLLIGAEGIGLGTGEPPETVSALTLVVVALYAGAFIWLLACYTAAIHRFRSEWPVVGAIVAATLIISSLYVMARGG